MAPMSHSPINFIRPVEKVLNLLLRFLELKKNVYQKCYENIVMGNVMGYIIFMNHRTNRNVGERLVM